MNLYNMARPCGNKLQSSGGIRPLGASLPEEGGCWTSGLLADLPAPCCSHASLSSKGRLKKKKKRPHWLHPFKPQCQRQRVLICLFLFETGFHYVVQAGLELQPGDQPASASASRGMGLKARATTPLLSGSVISWES